MIKRKLQKKDFCQEGRKHILKKKMQGLKTALAEQKKERQRLRKELRRAIERLHRVRPCQPSSSAQMVPPKLSEELRRKLFLKRMQEEHSES